MAEAGRALQAHVAVGNINLDVTLSIPRLPGPEENVRAEDFWVGLGGAAANYAIAVARLGHKSLLVARAGREARMLGLIDKLIGEGVDVTHVEVADEPIGVVVVLLIAGEGVRSMVTMRGANAGLSATLIPSTKGYDVLHLASVKPDIVLNAPRDAYRLVTYDPGGEVFVNPQGVREAASLVDIVMLNARELKALTGSDDPEAAKDLVSGRLKYVVVKKGKGGALVVSSGGVECSVNTFKVEKPVDVTGAGDAFDAAFNVWLLEYGDVEKALLAAVAAGAAKTLKKGSSSMPTRREVEELLSRATG